MDFEKKHRMMLVGGTSHPDFTRALSAELETPIANAHVGRFPDGEIDVKINEDIRGADVFVIQSTSPPVNDNWIELLLLIDTLRRASASMITAVMPYYGYARKDRKDEGRVPISAKVVANTLVASGADRVVTMDMHAAQIQGFYDIPVDHLYAKPALLDRVKQLGIDNPVVVTPDVGGTKMARAYAKELGADLAIVDKRRISGSEIAVEHVIGEVRDRNVVIIDDMIATGGSIAEAARIVKEKGAKQICLAVTHAVLAGEAVAKLDRSPADKILITDTIPPKERLPRQAEIVSVAPLFASAIQAIHRCESVSSLFLEPSQK